MIIKEYVQLQRLKEMNGNSDLVPWVRKVMMLDEQMCWTNPIKYIESDYVDTLLSSVGLVISQVF